MSQQELSTSNPSTPKQGPSDKPAKKATIGYYDIEKNIGEGNFAKVKLATHVLTGQKVPSALNVGGYQNH